MSPPRSAGHHMTGVRASGRLRRIALLAGLWLSPPAGAAGTSAPAEALALEWNAPNGAGWVALDPTTLAPTPSDRQAVRSPVRTRLRPEPAPAPGPADPCTALRVRRADGTWLSDFRSPAEPVTAPRDPRSPIELGACVAVSPRAIFLALGAPEQVGRASEEAWTAARLARYLPPVPTPPAPPAPTPPVAPSPAPPDP